MEPDAARVGLQVNATDPIVDPVRVLGMLFYTGAPLPQPFPACGLDPTPDRLDCAATGTACRG